MNARLPFLKPAQILAITATALLLTQGASADQPNPEYPLQVLPKAECMETLAAIFSPPEATLAEGLKALAEFNGDNTGIHSCLSEMSSNWKSYFPNKPALAAVVTTKFQAAYNELDQRQKCFNPYAAPGTANPPSYAEQYKKQMESTCGDKWISADERNELIKKKNQLQHASDIFQRIAGSFRLSQDEDRAKLQKAQQKLSYCKPNPYQEDNSYYYKNYQSTLASYCEGGVPLTPEQLTETQSLVNTLSQEINKKAQENTALIEKYSAIFSYGDFSDQVFAQMDSWLPLAEKLVCTNPFPENSPSAQNWNWNTNSVCGGKLGAPADFPEAKANFLAAIGDIDALKEKVFAERKARQEKIEEARRAAARLEYASYGQQRLLAYFQRFLKTGGGTDHLDTFCSAYEQEMLRDKKFFETTLPGASRMTMPRFDGSVGWMPVEKYGMTEAEYAILRNYIGSFYGTINKLLYTKQTSPALETYKDTLNSALDKIPAYSGDPLIRFAQLPPNVIEDHKLGEVITYDSFTSTSKNKNWNWGGNSRFAIYAGKNGKDLSKDFNGGEQEVLFKAGTRFKVVAKTETQARTYFILVEVDDQGAPMAAIVPPAGEAIP